MTRFVAERASSRLLDHVEHLDKVYNIPPPEGAKDPQTKTNVIAIPASPKLRYFLLKSDSDFIYSFEHYILIINNKHIYCRRL